MVDNVADGCWTNLGEVETYAEDQLRLRDYDLVRKGEGNYIFRAAAFGSRDNQGWCIVSVDIEVLKPTINEGIFGLHVIGSVASTLVTKDNINRLILNYAKQMSDLM